jgi:hypothetical protein
MAIVLKKPEVDINKRRRKKIPSSPFSEIIT